MKHFVTTALFVISSFITVATAPAQTLGFRATIPFSFTAGSQQLAAGTYWIRSDGHFVTLSRPGAQWSTVARATGAFETKPSENTRMVFSVYGDHRFLRRIVSPENNTALEFSPSKDERKLRQQVAISGSAG